MGWLPSLLGEGRLAGVRILAEVSPSGSLIEVGVYRGGSAAVLHEVAHRQNRELWLYDTFRGIPFADEIDSHKVGDFGDGMSLEDAIKAFPSARVQECVFPGTATLPQRIAFAHLDCDQYRSYREALDAILPRMDKGGMILCDDYALSGAAKAIDETPGDKVSLSDGRMVFRF